MTGEIPEGYQPAPDADTDAVDDAFERVAREARRLFQAEIK